MLRERRIHLHRVPPSPLTAHPDAQYQAGTRHDRGAAVAVCSIVSATGARSPASLRMLPVMPSGTTRRTGTRCPLHPLRASSAARYGYRRSHQRPCGHCSARGRAVCGRGRDAGHTLRQERALGVGHHPVPLRQDLTGVREDRAPHWCLDPCSPL